MYMYKFQKLKHVRLQNKISFLWMTWTACLLPSPTLLKSLSCAERFPCSFSPGLPPPLNWVHVSVGSEVACLGCKWIASLFLWLWRDSDYTGRRKGGREEERLYKEKRAWWEETCSREWLRVESYKRVIEDTRTAIKMIKRMERKRAERSWKYRVMGERE